MMKRLIFIVCILLFSGVLACAQSIRLSDGSDWWSINRKYPRTPVVAPGHQKLRSSNFSFAGVNLGHGGSDAITAKLGQTTEIERGDASTGRSQFCYTSATKGVTHVVFEFGEDESNFYLFSGGASWQGSNYCVRSKRIVDGVSTSSGLRLGLTRSEVEAILGRPDSNKADQFVYSRQFDQKSTPSEFETLRKDYPERLSDEEAHKKFDFYTVEQYILIRFSESKLAYLAVSVSGTGN